MLFSPVTSISKTLFRCFKLNNFTHKEKIMNELKPGSIENNVVSHFLIMSDITSVQAEELIKAGKVKIILTPSEPSYDIQVALSKAGFAVYFGLSHERIKEARKALGKFESSQFKVYNPSDCIGDISITFIMDNENFSSEEELDKTHFVYAQLMVDFLNDKDNVFKNNVPCLVGKFDVADLMNANEPRVFVVIKEKETVKQPIEIDEFSRTINYPVSTIEVNVFYPISLPLVWIVGTECQTYVNNVIADFFKEVIKSFRILKAKWLLTKRNVHFDVKYNFVHVIVEESQFQDATVRDDFIFPLVIAEELLRNNFNMR